MFFKQKTAYEVRISDWSSDVCSSDLLLDLVRCGPAAKRDADSVDAGKSLTDNGLFPCCRSAARGRPGSSHLAIPGHSGPSQANVAALRHAAACLRAALTGPKAALTLPP